MKKGSLEWARSTEMNCKLYTQEKADLYLSQLESQVLGPLVDKEKLNKEVMYLQWLTIMRVQLELCSLKPAKKDVNGIE